MPLPKPCSEPYCAEIAEVGRSRCRVHERDRDRARGTAASRGYSSAGHKRFRRAVLRRDPVCVLCEQRVSQHADHYPQSRKALVELGLDPNDPDYGRGLCHACHSKETMRLQPGGFTTES